MKFQTCRRHPEAGRFLAECSGCKQELFDIQQRNELAVAERLAAKVREALGLPGYGAPIEEAGETARRVSMWSQDELNAVYERVGGTVTARTVQRTCSTGLTWSVTEITVTVDLPGIGTVEAFTDWCEEYGGRDLPVMRAIPDAALAA